MPTLTTLVWSLGITALASCAGPVSTGSDVTRGKFGCPSEAGPDLVVAANWIVDGGVADWRFRAVEEWSQLLPGHLWPQGAISATGVIERASWASKEEFVEPWEGALTVPADRTRRAVDNVLRKLGDVELASGAAGLAGDLEPVLEVYRVHSHDGVVSSVWVLYRMDTVFRPTRVAGMVYREEVIRDGVGWCGLCDKNDEWYFRVALPVDGRVVGDRGRQALVWRLGFDIVRRGADRAASQSQSK
jgi:hypothetical protein